MVLHHGKREASTGGGGCWQYALEAFFFVGVMALLAINIPDLQTVINFVSGSFLVAIQLILPGWMLCGSDDSADNPKDARLGVFMMVIGFCIGTVCMVATFL